MYCKYCGAKTAGENDICENCFKQIMFSADGSEQRSERGVVSEFAPDCSTPASDTAIRRQFVDKAGKPITAKYCLGKGLASIIMGLVSVIALFIVSAVGEVALKAGTTGIDSVSFGILLCFSLGFAALVAGIDAIAGAAKALKLKIKATASLVLGIIGTVNAAHISLVGLYYIIMLANVL